MSATKPAVRYGAVAIALHWTIAGLILFNLALGWRMIRTAGLTKFELIQLHKSIGIMVLVLSLFRLAWRLAVPPPPLPPTLSQLERTLSKTVHWSFYALMFALPLTGWAMVSVSPLNIPTLLFGSIPWPALPTLGTLPLATKKALGATFDLAHFTLTVTAWLLIALHLAGAAKHRLVDRDGVLQRMLPNPFSRR